MANKKISELDSRASLSLSDLLAVGDPTTGYLYKITITDLKSLTGAGVISFNGRVGSVAPAEGDYTLNQLGDVIITTAANGNIIKYNGSNWVNVPMYTGTVSQYVDGTGAYQTFPTLLSSDRILTEVRNTTGATVTKGTVVYLNGSSGTLPLIAKAQANSESTSSNTYGVVQNDIANNANGYVVVIGNLTGLDTSAYTAGVTLWLSPTVAGGYTTTKPSAPDNIVYIGIVTRSSSTQGTIEVKIQNGYELDELHNVAISSVANNQVLVYESSTTLWKNKSIATILGFTPISLSSLSASSPLSYNSGTGAFSISQANGSTNGFLSSTDWTTFNNKQNALTNPVTGTGTSGHVTYFTGSTSVAGSANHFWDATNNRLGIGTTNPQRSLEIFNATADAHLRLSGAAPSVSMGEAVTGAVYQAKFGLVTANAQFVTGSLAGDFVIISQTGATIWVTSGGEKMRLTSGGNVGIGTTSPTSPLHIGNTTSGNQKIQQWGEPGFVDNYGLILRGSSLDGVFKFYGLNNGTETTNPILSMNRSSGNLGIGTTAPQYQAQITKTSANAVTDVLALHNGTNPAGGGTGARLLFKLSNFETSAETRKYASIEGVSTSDYNEDISLVFRTKAANADPAERVRITNAGNLLVGSTTTAYAASNRNVFEVNGATQSLIALKSGDVKQGYFFVTSNGGDMYLTKDTGTNSFIFQNQSNGVFLSVGATSWSSISDIRLKNINSNIDNAIDSLMTLQAINYSWKSDAHKKENLGLIAQEVEKVFPQVISKSKFKGNNATNISEDNTEYLSVRYAELVPVLIKAIQEQQAQIEQLKNK